MSNCHKLSVRHWRLEQGCYYLKEICEFTQMYVLSYLLTRDRNKLLPILWWTDKWFCILERKLRMFNDLLAILHL